MVRTQIYLTDSEREQLAALARSTGKKQSELIREALDKFMNDLSSQRRREVLQRARGLWRDRTDAPNADDLRREWDREHA